MARVKTKKRILPVQTRYGAHVCELTLDPNGKGYTVIAKHLPGVVTQGRTLYEAEAMAREAIELCIECIAREHPRQPKRRLGRRTLVVTGA